ncbi:lysine transporter LysE [Thioalkalivibrio denitrificans]|uniref:Lysine transporter LysE n=1 Tax=Thioalkalivibrio denitrificans TaxID=108003 RepID=A0A1V3NC78_9GAMM|nr:lysine transporter LysE [Thioalkalivibrio denitrificans]
MSLDILVALTAYALVMTITPGPNNILLFASGLAFGLRRTVWHMAGILLGVLLQIGLVGVGLGVLLTREPAVQVVLKLVGSIYMLWLTRKLWGTREWQTMETARPIRFHEAAVFQFVNPKAWLMATTVIAAFVPPGEHYAERVLIAGLVFTAVALPCICLWAGSGGALRVWIQDPVVLWKVNRAMAVLAAATVILFWL